MRASAARALRAFATPQFARQASAVRPHLATSFLQSSRSVPSFIIPSIRCYSAPAGLTKEEVQGRIMDLLKNFDKVGLRVSNVVMQWLTFWSDYRCIKGMIIRCEDLSKSIVLTDLDLRKFSLFQRFGSGQFGHRRSCDGYWGRIQHRDSRQGGRRDSQWYAKFLKRIRITIWQEDTVDQAVTYITAQPDAH